MYFYVKVRKIGTFVWKALREQNKILIFKKYELAKKHVQAMENTVYKIVSLEVHPSNKQSSIYGKKYMFA